ncbi:MAG: IS1182 family transposase [Candidatus Sulfotelmatobacter sp.]
MSRFLEYSPEQAYLLPPSVKDELGADHLSFFLHRMVERLDLSEFERAYSDEGGVLYAPALMLKVWLYAYALGMTSARRLEQRIVEDLALRYLAGGQRPDHWALSAFRRRHARALNDVFTQVVEMARQLGMGKLGMVALDSTRIRASASRERIDTEPRLRRERAKIRRQIRRWQKACEACDPDEGAGTRVRVEKLEQRLAELPRRLERLRKSGEAKLSPRDAEARFLRERGGFALGYTAEMAVSQDHLIVAQRVTLNRCDVPALVPLVEEVEERTGERPEKALADAGFYSNENVRALEERGIDVYLPDPNLARELNTGKRARTIGRNRVRSPELKAMRKKLRGAAGRKVYGRRKALVEPVFGVLKQQRGMRQFRTRGQAKVAAEFTLAAIAYNVTRLFARR